MRPPLASLQLIAGHSLFVGGTRRSWQPLCRIPSRITAAGFDILEPSVRSHHSSDRPSAVLWCGLYLVVSVWCLKASTRCCVAVCGGGDHWPQCIGFLLPWYSVCWWLLVISLLLLVACYFASSACDMHWGCRLDPRELVLLFDRFPPSSKSSAMIISVSRFDTLYGLRKILRLGVQFLMSLS